ncbi:hypothetical protein, partial [Pseudonocardia halophobica]|uniref:hypothetical protein n=1 Tax=Pseudonocardia halophobica TaxID=29401 RepID=UPI0022F33BA0
MAGQVKHSSSPLCRTRKAAFANPACQRLRNNLTIPHPSLKFTCRETSMSFRIQPAAPARPNRCQLFGPGSR